MMDHSFNIFVTKHQMRWGALQVSVGVTGVLRGPSGLPWFVLCKTVVSKLYAVLSMTIVYHYNGLLDASSHGIRIVCVQNRQRIVWYC